MIIIRLLLLLLLLSLLLLLCFKFKLTHGLTDCSSHHAIRYAPNVGARGLITRFTLHKHAS